MTCAAMERHSFAARKSVCRIACIRFRLDGRYVSVKGRRRRLTEALRLCTQPFRTDGARGVRRDRFWWIRANTTQFIRNRT